ncbi:MAG: hypothetical protein PVI86_16405 [Phycisphaerae bacterium]|jgi:hypothetical protein
MRLRPTTWAILFLPFSLSACSIAGSWRVVSTDPPEAPFPVEVVTFDPQHNYTATSSKTLKRGGSTGKYRWNGFRLEIAESGKSPRTYKARRQPDGTLVLTYEENGIGVSATLVRTEPPVTAARPGTDGQE